MKSCGKYAPRQWIVLFFLFFCAAILLGDIFSPSQRCIWGINNQELSISDGSIIVEAVITVGGITNISENPDDILYIHLLDNPAEGFTTIDANEPYSDFGDEVLLADGYCDKTFGKENLVYRFGELNDESNVLWSRFGYPLEFGTEEVWSVIDSSYLLELIDFAGTGSGFGFGFSAEGQSEFEYNSLVLDITIAPYLGAGEVITETFVIGEPDSEIPLPEPDSAAPVPDPMSWSQVPYATSSTSVSMVATTASDESGVQYYFACLTDGGHDSGWQDSTEYEDTGLVSEIEYGYTVKARDLSLNYNETFESIAAYVTTLPIAVPEIYVYDISMSSFNKGINYFGVATVHIKDDLGFDVSGAAVYGQWSGAIESSASEMTGFDGKAVFTSDKVKEGGEFYFTVINVVDNNYGYNSALNNEMNDLITAP